MFFWKENIWNNFQNLKFILYFKSLWILSSGVFTVRFIVSNLFLFLSNVSETIFLLNLLTYQKNKPANGINSKNNL